MAAHPDGPERRHLAALEAPSANVLVCLAAGIDPPPAQFNLWGSTAVPAAPSRDVDQYVIYGGTIALGSVVLQVLYTTIPDLPVAYALEERPAINLIWPYRAPFDWAERDEFAEQGFLGYMHELQSVLRSVA